MVKRKSVVSNGRYVQTSFFEKNIHKLSQFDPTEVSVEQEKNTSLSLLAKMDSDRKKMRKEPRAEETELNVRKAVRFASKGKGGLALGREVVSRTSRGRRGGQGKGGRGR